MAELTVEQRDALLIQNSDYLKRQTAAVEAAVAVLQAEAAQLLTPRQYAIADLYKTMLEVRKTAMSTAITDATLADIAKDALLMTNAVRDDYLATMGL